MKKHLAFLVVILFAAAPVLLAQDNPIYGKKIILKTRDTSSAELQIINSTRNVTGGFLMNTGSGNTQFVALPNYVLYTRFMDSLAQVQSRIQLRLKISDTAAMLGNLLRKSDTAAMLANRLKISDTAAMLGNLLRKSDTAAMLANRLKISDTAAMLGNLLRKSDTAAMLANRLKISDTAVMMGNSLRKSGDAMTGPLTLSGDPVNALHAVTKNYVDNLLTGLSWKQSVKAATTANISLNGAQTIDGVSVIAGDRVLVKNQSTASNNGVYLVASGSWTRTADADAASELVGATVYVDAGGSVNGGTQWSNNNASITLGSTSISFIQIAGAGVYTNGTGLSLTGNVFSIDNTVVTLTGTQTLTNKTIAGYLTTSTASSTYLPFSGGNVTGSITMTNVNGGLNLRSSTGTGSPSTLQVKSDWYTSGAAYNIGHIRFENNTDSKTMFIAGLSSPTGLAMIYEPSAGTGTTITHKFGIDGSLTAGVITGTSFTGAGTGLTGTASALSIGGNAATATNSTQWNGKTYTHSNGPVSSYVMSWDGSGFHLSGSSELKSFAGYYTSGDNVSFGNVNANVFKSYNSVFSGDNSGQFDINYNTGYSGSLVYWGGTTSQKFSVTNSGNATFGGQLLLSGNTSFPSSAGIARSATTGLTFRGHSGSSYDFFYANSSGADVMYNPTGTTNINIVGAVTSGGSITASSVAITGGTSSQSLLANGSVTTLTSGTYTPSFTYTSNTSYGGTPYVCRYTRIGNNVSVDGFVVVSNSTSSTCTFEITLPISSTLGSAADLAGTAVSDGNGVPEEYIHAAIYSSGSGKAMFKYKSASAAGQSFAFHFSYIVN